MKSLKRALMQASLILITLLMITPAFAQKIKVRKVKGNQAVVEFSGEPLQTGNVYELAGDDFGGSSSGGSRDHALGLNFAFNSGKQDTSGAESVTTILLDTRFGWNFGQYELGPVLSYESDNSTDTSFIAGGLFGDFNLIPNVSGEDFIYGMGGQLSFGTIDFGGGLSGSVMALNAGPFVKWFGLANNFCVRFDLAYKYQKSSASGTDTTYTGFVATAGLATYF